MFTKEQLSKLYIEEKLSMKQIATIRNCSTNSVLHWMEKYGIQRRSISDAVYQRCNPNGDPFTVNPVITLEDAELYGKGIGLYWGEGNKLNKYSVRLGNSDPELINTFMNFLIRFFGVKKSDFRFSLQIFTDIRAEDAFNYWTKRLGVPRTSFGQAHVTASGSIGTYTKRCLYGVVTVYYHNKKLRDIIVGLLPR